MSVFLRLISSLYYTVLVFVIIIGVFYISVNYNNTSSMFDRMLISNLLVICFLFISGFQSSMGRHKKWIPKQLFSVILFTAITSLVVLLLTIISDLTNYKTLCFLILSLIPCVLHNINYYIRFDKITYDLRMIREKVFNEYSEIVDLNLPYLKIVNQNNASITFQLTSSKTVGYYFIAVFLILWLIGWFLGSIVLFEKEPILSIILLIIMIPLSTLFFRHICTTIFLFIEQQGVTIIEKPFKKEIQVKNISFIKCMYIQHGKGGPTYVLKTTEGKEVTLGKYSSNETVYIIEKILEIHHKKQAGL